MDAFAEQLRELWSERRRVFWVALGVAWGTLSLTMLVAFGSSFVSATHQTINNFGENLVRFGSGSTTIPYQGIAAGRYIPLTKNDADALRKGVIGVKKLGIEYSSGEVNPMEYGNVRINVSLSGCEPIFESLRGMIPQPGGRFINKLDVEEHRRVCFLGHRTKDLLFGDAEAVGKTVLLYDQPYLVIGVRAENVSISGYNGDDREKVSIPYTSFKDLRGWTNPSFILVGLDHLANKTEVFASIYSIMGARHQFDPADTDALDTQDYMELTQRIDGMLDGNRYFNGIVGFFGLLVSILGVMNVMYVLVEERSKEIGVRMALGALPKQILRERLLEAILVTLIGGVVGILSCMGLFSIVNLIPVGEDARAFMGYPTMSLGLAILVTLILTLAGSAAGWHPARRAALMDPVEALREE